MAEWTLERASDGEELLATVLTGFQPAAAGEIGEEA